MKKDLLKLLLFGVAGGIIGAYSLFCLDSTLLGNIFTASNTNDESVISSPAVSPLPAPGVWQSVISLNSPKVVALQVFRDNKLIKQGSGLIVSSDGLIVTVSDMALFRGTYQVFYGDKIIKGNIVSYDAGSGLMLLKTDSSQTDVADLRNIDFSGGEEIVIVGKTVSLSTPEVFSQRGSVRSISGKSATLDSIFTNDLAGTVSFDSEGNLLGINFLRNARINLINSGAIADFLQKYLDKQNR